MTDEQAAQLSFIYQDCRSNYSGPEFRISKLIIDSTAGRNTLIIDVDRYTELEIENSTYATPATVLSHYIYGIPQRNVLSGKIEIAYNINGYHKYDISQYDQLLFLVQSHPNNNCYQEYTNMVFRDTSLA